MTTNLNETFAAVQVASRELALLNDDIINQILNAVADAAIAETPFILAENEKDLARMDKNDPKYWEHYFAREIDTLCGQDMENIIAKSTLFQKNASTRKIPSANAACARYHG